MTKYPNENEEIEFLEIERSYKPKCNTCSSRLFVKSSIRESKCQRCQDKAYRSSTAYLAKITNNAIFYPEFDSVQEANNYFGLV